MLRPIMRQRTTSICIALLSLAGFACSSDDSDTGNATTPTTTDHGATSHDHGATTHDHGATTHDHGATTHDHGATTHDHGGTHGADTHGGHDHTIDTDGSDPAVAYCMCVFVNCHEQYHAKWGEDEMVSEQACLAEAGALPSNGAPIETGNFIECREHFCELAQADSTQCDAALGNTVCI